MSEPFGDKWKRYTVWPKLTNQSGATVEKIKLNIGSPSSLTGATGPTGATGATGPTGNPDMRLTSPNGTIWQLEIDDLGVITASVVG